MAKKKNNLDVNDKLDDFNFLDDETMDLFGDMVLLVLLGKVLGKALGSDVLGNALGEHALARLLDGLGVDICGEDLDLAAASRLFQELLQEDGDGISLFTGRTAGRPDADGLAVIAVIDDIGEDEGLELFKELLVAEETRHPDEDVLHEQFRFVGVFLQ